MNKNQPFVFGLHEIGEDDSVSYRKVNQKFGEEWITNLIPFMDYSVGLWNFAVSIDESDDEVEKW